MIYVSDQKDQERRKWPLEITVSYHATHGTPVIAAGKASYNYFEMLPKSKAKMLQSVRFFLDEGYVPYHSSYYDDYGAILKEKYTWLGESLGYRFADAWNKTMYREWVVPLHDPAYKLCFGRYGNRGSLGYHHNLLLMLWKNRELVEQCWKDGTVNISPLVLTAGESPKDLKSQFGNGAWKKICGNSFSRNKLLCYKFGFADGGNLMPLLDIPTTALTKMASHHATPHPAIVAEFLRMKKERRLKTLAPHVITNMSYVIRDTERMAEQLGETFNDRWSFNRIEEEHVKLQNRITIQKYSPEPFAPEALCGPGSVEGEDFSLVYLDTALDVAEEGNAQHHCVASYVAEARRGACSIYSLRDKTGERLTTVQLYPNGRLGQHYGKFNRQPTIEEATFVMSTLVKWRQDTEAHTSDFIL